MSDRIKRELALVRLAYGDLEVDVHLRWFVIRRWVLVPGWNKDSTRVLVLIPPGYAVTAPDNFYTDPDLALASGVKPGATSGPVEQAGRQWLQFSYHIEAGDWQPESGHDLLTFLVGVYLRLKEVS
jgi:hypothetical protein